MRLVPTAVLTVLLLALCAGPAGVVHAADTPEARATYRLGVYPAPSDLPADVRGYARSLGGIERVGAAADTFLLAAFDFEGAGMADPQGWMGVDRTAELREFFHVANGTELDGGNFGRLTPLEGSQSMWCGAAASLSNTDPFCLWATLQGYGNNWDQILLSQPFACDSLHVSYRVFWDSEGQFDQTTFEYTNDGGASWQALFAGKGMTVTPGVYDGTGPAGGIVESFTVSGGGAVQVRFRFTSDSGFSNEDGLNVTDGAVTVDSITVACWNGGVVTETFFEDFEGETPGSGATDDGVWTATQPTPYGDFADLYRGTTLLQEDPCIVNPSFVWGWFDDPVFTNYSCHEPDPRPDVGAMPYGNNAGLFLQNEIWSPLIPNSGAGDEYMLSFRAYRDLPLDNLQFYAWQIEPFFNGCSSGSSFDPFLLFGADRDWVTHTFNTGSIAPGASHVQIRFWVLDQCGVWCNIFGSGSCHSQAPLIDDVRLVRVNNTAPQFTVDHAMLFQDNFNEDGTLTGTARADAARSITPAASPRIVPGDSIVIAVRDVSSGLATDPVSGTGPAIYVYLDLRPAGQMDKDALNLEAPELRSIGKRFPFLDSVSHDGTTWYRFRMDTVRTVGGGLVTDRYCFDLNDAVFSPGDTIRYAFGAENQSGTRRYWSRRLNGQGDGFTTDDLWEVLSSPCEFTILPAGGWLRGGDILYVDDTDDRGGPAQLLFDTAFRVLNIDDKVDRFDVLAPSSFVGNSLASRVKNPQTQINNTYSKMIWNSGDLRSGLVGDGGAPNGGNGPEKSDDWALLFEFLHTQINNPGLYLSGDNVASELLRLTGASAVNTRSVYIAYSLDPTSPDGDHVAGGEPVSPTIAGIGPALVGDSLLVYGGCPSINDFDLLAPAPGISVTEMRNPFSDRSYVLSQQTTNGVGATARVVLSGYSFHNIRDFGDPIAVPARVTHLQRILEWLGSVTTPTGLPSDVAMVSTLKPAYPNPFNPSTTIRYAVARRGPVTLEIFNVAGQRVRTLVDEVQTPRPEGFAVEWDGRTVTGALASSGVYFYRLRAPGFTQTRKMVLLK